MCTSPVGGARQGSTDSSTGSLASELCHRLPAILQWFSGNIGFHHIHHLGSRIPNYFLETAQREVEIFRTVKPLTLRASLRCLKFRLWDEESRRLVGFDHVKEISRQVSPGSV